MIRFEWEPGVLHLRKGGGASLSGRMRGDATPPLSIAQSRGPSLPSPSARRVGEARCYKSRSPRPSTPYHSALPHCVLSPVLRAIYKWGFLTLLPVSCSRGLSAPVLRRCLCPRVRDAALHSHFPSGSGVCMGKSLCQLCRWRCGWGEDGQWGAPP